MTGPERRGRDKFIGFFRLVDACERPGCPVCRCLALDARQYLEGLLHEAVTDPDIRTRLYSSWGFCNWHGWLLRETPVPAFGASILYEDLLRLAIERLASPSRRRVPGPRGLLGWLRRRLGRPQAPERAAVYRHRTVCPGCRQTAGSEERYLRTALRFVDDDQFASAYGRSQGFCVPHVIRALELGAGGHQAETLIAWTLPKWAELRRDLAAFVAKHDHQRRQPFSEAEGTAYLRALETLRGAPGVFGNEARRGERPDDAPRATDGR